jgi:tetratricopeptide (TPR) repeat protein
MLPCRVLCGRLAFIALLGQRCPAQTNPADAQNIEPVEMELMMRQADPDMKVLLLDRFGKDYQRAGMIHWAYDEVCKSFEASGQPIRALAAGEKLMMLDPRDVEIARKSLKIAEDQKDAALIEKWSAIAARAAGSGDTGNAGALHDHVEYLAYSGIARIADPGRKRAAIEEFLKSHKCSPYKTAVEDLYLQSWRESGDPQSTVAAAKRILEQDDSNLTALAIVADSYLQSEKEPNKLMAYARKILAVLDKQSKQEGLTDAEWSRMKAPLKGHAYWMIASVSMQQNRYSDADKSIRTALPYLKDDNQLLSTALFYLGWANYQLGNLSDAVRFNRQCALVKGPYQAQAARSVQVIGAQVDALNRNRGLSQ